MSRPRLARLSGAVGFIAGVAIAVLVTTPAPEPVPLPPTASELAAITVVSPANAYPLSCPTEDSCSYADGHWAVSR